MKSPTLASRITARRFSRTALLVAVGALGFAAPRGNPAAAGRPKEAGALAGIRPETRLRKLHLVRPDLIPYPIAYEVYC